MVVLELITFLAMRTRSLFYFFKFTYTFLIEFISFSGLVFFDKNRKMAVFGLNTDRSKQHGYYQSVIYFNKSGLCLEDVPESPYKLAKRLELNGVTFSN